MRPRCALIEADLPFIRAILKSPVERRPHLVYNLQPRSEYADWLERSADRRAEYVRVWVALYEVVDSGEKAPQRLLDRLTALHRRVNGHWAGFISFNEPRAEVVAAEEFSGILMPTSDARLGYGPCVVCGRSTDMLHWVSRMPCSKCQRVFCWECADTGVHGSLPDFRHFISGPFSFPGYRLWPESCPFCQSADWMSTHGG